MRWYRFLFGSMLLAALMLALAPLAERQISPSLANYWKNQVLSADDADAPRLMKSLTSLHAPGIRALVELLACDRAVVHSTAELLLSGEVTQALRLDGAARSDRLDTLVEALAAEVEHFGPAGRQFAEDVVRQLLGTGSPEHPCLSDFALPACEQILQVVNQDHRLRRHARQDANPADIEAVLAPFERLAVAQPSAPAAPAEEAMTTIEASPEPQLEANANEPMRVLPPEEDSAQSIAEEPATLDLDDDPMRELPEIPTARRHAGAGRQLNLTQPAAAQIGGAPTPPPAGPPEEVRIITWIRQLRDADPQIVHQAEQALSAAGFDRRRLDLARQLTSPDPSIREQLAEALPRIEGIDAKTWLIWLSRDERTEVRLAAISVMATINDPEMSRRVEDMARRDPDPRVQRQGERLMELRGGARSQMHR
jgi:hypothetical protein